VAGDDERAGDAILSAAGIHKRFGGVHALRNARLDVAPGEVHALVGENGSGKSTLLKILSGQLQPDAGTIRLDGRERSFRGPPDALAQGIATVTQETTLAPDLSIAENIFLGHRMAKRFGLVDWSRTKARAVEALGRLGLEHLDPGTIARRLRPDQQQMVEIARAISIDARVLILDEPTSSLTDDEVAALFAAVARLKEQGVAIVFVSHRLNEIFAVADHVTVLRDGHTVGDGPCGSFDRQSLVTLMVGRAVEDVQADHDVAVHESPALRLRGVGVAGAVEDVDLDVGHGEIVGLAGLVGAGRSELLEAIFGVRARTGTVEVDGRPASISGPRGAIRAGVAFVPADRKNQGLVLEMNVRENLVMASTSRLSRLRWPSAGAELREVSDAIERLDIRAHSPRASVATLSGGNQQKVVLGKWLATRPRVLMLDEPTRGVDVGAKGEIYRLLFQAAQEGMGVLVSSSEVPELLLLCDRIAVMFRGRVVASLSRGEASEATIALYAGGTA
jgi:ABC-type sugar transport system ATPase subunit